jgi:hypothetical protein
VIQHRQMLALLWLQLEGHRSSSSVRIHMIFCADTTQIPGEHNSMSSSCTCDLGAHECCLPIGVHVTQQLPCRCCCTICRPLATTAASVTALCTALFWTAGCRDDRPLIPITAPFAFAERGHIDITLQHIGMYRRHDQVGSCGCVSLNQSHKQHLVYGP